MDAYTVYHLPTS